jgi:FlaA1/EpsC-like NDP-sugar epimerase
MADARNDGEKHHRAGDGPYVKFMAMIGTSTVVMFALMYLNTYAIDHVFWSETRFWMAFVMGAAMMVVMLLFMWGMYRSTTKNVVILGVAAVVFVLALWLVRSQSTVTDTEYMRAMIPHHSIAIMTSERAQIRDPRVRELAQGIIDAQRREIAEMKALIDDIEEHGVRTARRTGADPAPISAGD